MSATPITIPTLPDDDDRGDVDTLATRYLFDLVAELEHPRLDLGDGPLGRRFFDRVRSARFDGPRLRGEVLPGSGDPLLYRHDGTAAIDARAVLRTHDGADLDDLLGPDRASRRGPPGARRPGHQTRG